MDKFKALGISEDTLLALEKKGFVEPSPIQEQAIPLLLSGEKDVIGQAQTGTGKTAAFGIPIIEKLQPQSDKVQALVLTPTRELAVQVCDELLSFKGQKKLKIISIYGGQSIDRQMNQLRKGVDVVVGTPGRIIDHIHRGTLHLDAIRYLILDEADEMLNMGFVDDIEEILEHTPREKSMLLFSATMPSKILDLAKSYMRNYEVIRIEKKELTNNNVEQVYHAVSQKDKFIALSRILDMYTDFYGVIFCQTKRNTEEVSERLQQKKYRAEALHGDISQNNRERTLQRFKKQQINILVATDVAARGIDVNNLTHVINYSLPQDPESYVHRIGRTGRAGNKGMAISLVAPFEIKQMGVIKRLSKADIEKKALPSISEIISNKKEKIKKDIYDYIDKEGIVEYDLMASSLLERASPERVISALLQRFLKDQLNPNGYKVIRENTTNRKEYDKQNEGFTRLFIAKGKTDGYNRTSLIELIESEVPLRITQVERIKILDNFSFMSIPEEDAHIILSVFKKINRRQPLIVRAKEEQRDKSTYGRHNRFSKNKSFHKRSKRFDRKR